jgi:hypothetical protein
MLLSCTACRQWLKFKTAYSSLEDGKHSIYCNQPVFGIHELNRSLPCLNIKLGSISCPGKRSGSFFSPKKLSLSNASYHIPATSKYSEISSVQSAIPSFRIRIRIYSIAHFFVSSWYHSTSNCPSVEQFFVVVASWWCWCWWYK